jgi:putative transposase
MNKRRTDDEVTRLLKDADRDLAKGLTVSDFCRKVGVAQTTYHRWRKRHDPKRVDSDRRCRQLEAEVERLKRLVAERLLDKQLLRDVAKKSGGPRPAAGRRGIPGRGVQDLAAEGRPGDRSLAIDLAIRSEAPIRRAAAGP